MISNKEINAALLNITPRQIKYLYADSHGYSRISPIKRTRKRQIEKARMLAMTHSQRRMYKAFSALHTAILGVCVSTKDVVRFF